jgi:hypothetical protein
VDTHVEVFPRSAVEVQGADYVLGDPIDAGVDGQNVRGHGVGFGTDPDPVADV